MHLFNEKKKDAREIIFEIFVINKPLLAMSETLIMQTDTSESISVITKTPEGIIFKHPM
jgi:hypothetical protein